MVLAMMLTGVVAMLGQTPKQIVADSATHVPLGNASVFDRRGKYIGTTSRNGSIGCARTSSYPLTVRYMGFQEKMIDYPDADTVFMSEDTAWLPEVIVESKSRRMLHILAYVRETSTLSTYTDTVFLFREKLVDFMISPDSGGKMKGWRTPRVISSRSYYRFTDSHGLDSVSDACGNHFTWSDWVGVVPETLLPGALADSDNGEVTLAARNGTSERWRKQSDKVSVVVDVLSGKAEKRWVPDLAVFFNSHTEFDKFVLEARFSNVSDNRIRPSDLDYYKVEIESRGRGHSMFEFNRPEEPFFVETKAETFILDKEYIGVSDAKKWERNKPSMDDLGIYRPLEAEPLSEEVVALMTRVGLIDHEGIRLDQTPDRRLMAPPRAPVTFGRAVLDRIKGMFGIDQIAGRRKQNKRWKKFRHEQLERTRKRNVSQP